MTRNVHVPEDVKLNQRRASDPESSVWVSANAGSGKTHVLTERVLRLMLADVAPEQILCLTYTKAAAAEMRGRVGKRLGEWALADEAKLSAKLEQLTGKRPDPKTLSRARSLFAHALETPGGLKILTIHAFSESVLHRFPREAGVPFDFTVIEDRDREELIARARESVMAEGLNGEPDGPVEALFGLLSDYSINEAIDEALAQQRKLRDIVADVPAAKARLRELVGGASGVAEVMRRAIEESVFAPERWAELFAHVPPDTTKTQRLNFSERLYRIRNNPGDANALFDAFLKDGREPYKDRCIAKITDAALAEDVGAEHDRLAALAAERVAAELIERSEALLDVLAAIFARYESLKRARSLLDFDDLIAALARLLENDALGPWVRYKLDSGISHVLVDESQDTNLDQWRLVRSLASEFFEHEHGGDRLRTLFAVGDQKQSIFSFQGAEPLLFVDQGRQYWAEAQTAQVKFDQVPLQTSFRTLPDILTAVDRVFAAEPLRESVLSDEGVKHYTARMDKGGVVTLWPPIQDQAEELDSDSWPLDPPKSVKSAARQVAERIAAEIKDWVTSRRPLGPRKRAVTADDVLILVQTRGPLFQEVIRALVRQGLPTPGADRLAVTSHIAVLDLMALGDVLLNPNDDLQLAALLRSPLFEVSEDDLYRLAHPRAKGESLWAALGASQIDSVRDAYGRLSQWRERLDFERVFEFYAEVLYAGGGLKRFHARLGPEIDDVMSEFLDLALAHEQEAQPSLQGFLAALRARDVEIKRELAESGGGVRVMTVHGAKGLEAPIVILADAASTEKGRLGRSVYLLERDPGPLLIHAASTKAHAPQTLRFKQDADDAQQEEYWRKLYVAMTRAEDELYVTGFLTPRGTLEDSWYEAIDAALRDEAEVMTDAEGNEAALIYPRLREAVPKVEHRDAPAEVEAAAVLKPLPSYRLTRIVRPSSAFAESDPEAVLMTRAEEAVIRDPEIARREGVALHALLQHLPKLPRETWGAMAQKALPVLLPDLAASYAKLTERALSILGNPVLEHLFGPDSRGEVPVLARCTRNGEKITVAGRIDRLLVTDDRVTIIDFKSDAKVPHDPADVPPAYLTQLGLYALIAGLLFPRRQVIAQILWTELESLMNLPPDRLREAVAGFTIG